MVTVAVLSKCHSEAEGRRIREVTDVSARNSDTFCAIL